MDQEAKREKLNPTTPLRALVANFVADELAGLAAERAEVPTKELDSFRQLEGWAKATVHRIGKVAHRVAQAHKEAERAQKAEMAEAGLEERQPRKRVSMGCLAAGSSHRLRSLVAGGKASAVRCSLCLGVPRKGFLRRFLAQPCPGRGSRATPGVTRPDPTHRLSLIGEQLTCRVCGSKGTTKLRELRKPCPRVAGRGGDRSATLHFLAAGGAELGRAGQEFELEIEGLPD